jgi:hypothetical protein
LLQEWLQSNGCAVDDKDTKKILVAKACAFIDKQFKYGCVQLAEEQKHKVVVIAPYHSDL